LPEEEIETIMSEADLDGDGKVDYHEFIKFWRDFTIAQKLTPIQRFTKAVRQVTKGLSLIRAMRKSVDLTKSPSISPMISGVSSAADDLPMDCESTDQFHNARSALEGGPDKRPPGAISMELDGGYEAKGTKYAKVEMAMDIGNSTSLETHMGKIRPQLLPTNRPPQQPLIDALARRTFIPTSDTRRVGLELHEPTTLPSSTATISPTVSMSKSS